MTDVVDEDLTSTASSSGRSTSITPTAEAPTAKATSGRAALVASTGGRWSGKARFRFAVL